MVFTAMAGTTPQHHVCHVFKEVDGRGDEQVTGRRWKAVLTRKIELDGVEKKGG